MQIFPGIDYEQRYKDKANLEHYLSCKLFPSWDPCHTNYPFPNESKVETEPQCDGEVIEFGETPTSLARDFLRGKYESDDSASLEKAAAKFALQILDVNEISDDRSIPAGACLEMPSS